MKSLINYFQEVRLELTKVSWPKREEVIKLTLTVFVFSAIIALYLGGLDLFFTKLLDTIIKK